jgi:AcrR family transcriptional regulator
MRRPTAKVKSKRTWTQKDTSQRAQRALATRDKLMIAARQLFAERGYHAVGVRDITARAGVTRGALGHHFAGKEALFETVFDQIERELTAASAAAAGDLIDLDPWARLRAGIQAYLDAILLPDAQRITLIDGPAVLGWRRWREIEQSYSLGTLRMVLQTAMHERLIRSRPVDPLSHLLFGSIMEAALLIANSEHPAARRKEVGDALDDWLRGLEPQS